MVTVPEIIYENEIFIAKKNMLTIRMVPDKEHRAPNKVDDTVHAHKIVDTFAYTSLCVHGY